MLIIFWIAAGLILYTYIGYPLILLLFRDGFHKEFQRAPIVPPVTLIVAAYNEEKVIEAKLKNCLELDYPREKLEIIIGSDGSADATNSIVERYKDKGVSLFAFEDRTGKITVLNKTVEVAKGEIIVFSDANTMYEPNVIRNLARNFADERVGAVCGELRFYAPDDTSAGNAEGAYWRLEQFMKRIEGSHGSLLGANGGLYAVRKDLYEALPGDTLIEDFVLPMKILQRGHAVIYEPQAVAYEETTEDVKAEEVRRVRIGAGGFQSLRLLYGLLNPLKGVTALSFFSHKVIRWFVPFFMIVAFIANLFLVHQSLYAFLFGAQCVFYLIALCGRVFLAGKLHLGIFGFPCYFVAMNYALLRGFFRYLSGTQKVTWDRTER